MANSQFHEAMSRLPSGVKLHYAEAGRHGPTMLLLHGYTDSWRSFESVLPWLATGARVVAVDQRGHGQSSAPAGDYSIGRLAEDARELLDELGVPQAIVVGHSLGSFVARRLALTQPSRVTGLVLIGAGATADNASVRQLMVEVEPLAERVPRTFVELFQASCVLRPELLPPGFLAQCVDQSMQVPGHVWRTALSGLLAEADETRLDRISQPTLILGGLADTVFSAEEQARLAKRIPRSQFRTYQFCGHTPHWEQPGRVAEDVLAFLHHHFFQS